MPNLKITLYDPETNEIVKECSRAFIPWKVLKRAIRLMKNFKPEDISEEDADELAALVVDAFGGQFTLDELNNGADLSEMMTVLTGIMASAQGISPNPPPQGRP